MPSTEDLLREGLEAAKFGERERARTLLLQVVERDEESVLAWLRLVPVRQ